MIRAPPREGEMGLANVPFPQFIVIHTVKVFDIVNKAEIDVKSLAFLMMLAI